MLPHWDKKYKAFYVEANLMFGLKSYGKITTRYSHANFTKHGFSLVNFSFWVNFFHFFYFIFLFFKFRPNMQ